MTTSDGGHNQGVGGVDWLRPGALDPKEREQLVKWYSDLHGEGNLDLSAFLQFWLKHDDEVFKQYRRAIQACFVGSEMSEAVSFLLFLPSYVAEGYEPGVLYEVIGCRRTGMTRRQILDAVALAFLHSGPMGMNRIARGADDYFSKWTQDEKPVADLWPKGWTPDGGAFKSGLDFAKPGMTPAEIESLERWHLENQGEIPPYVTYFAKWNPESLKAWRSRYERCVNTLPKQSIPLVMFHTAAMKRDAGAMRRYAFQARRYGVRRSDMNVLVTFLFTVGYDMTDTVIDTLQPLIDRWAD